jgi:hypothetical protein
MRIQKILLGRSIRYLDFVQKDQKVVPPGRITRLIQSRYDFLQAPTTIADYNFQTGVTFLMGNFQDTLIHKLQIFERGILCETEASTDLCDGFLDDLAAWLEQEFQQPSKEIDPVARIYTSNLELHSDVNLAETMRALAPVGQAIWEYLKSYGQAAMFEFSGIKFHTDTTQLVAIRPLEFIFERRADKPYRSNIYFAAAPLRTGDHAKILQDLEAVLISSNAARQHV